MPVLSNSRPEFAAIPSFPHKKTKAVGVGSGSLFLLNDDILKVDKEKVLILVKKDFVDKGRDGWALYGKLRIEWI